MVVPMEEENKKLNWYSLGCSIVASIISIVFGYDTGVMSGAKIFLEEDLKLNDNQMATLIGILNWAALVGSLTAGKLADLIGRRRTVMVASLIFFVGSVLMGYAPFYSVLLSGRIIAGLGVGYALMIAPVYAAEVSAPEARGLLSSLPELCISFGILLGYLSNYFLSKLPLHLGWRLMLGIPVGPAILLAIFINWMPESPRWLVMQGRLKDGKQVLLQVCNTQEEAESRLRQIKIAAGIDESCTEDRVQVPKTAGGKGVWKELLWKPSPAVRRILLAGVGIHFFEHACGIEAVVLYSPTILKGAGVVTKDKLLLGTIFVGVTKFTFILISTLLLDKAGRRVLLLTSCAGMTVFLGILATGLTIVAKHPGEHLKWAMYTCIGSVYAFCAFFAMGMGPICWVYSSEIFPLRLRAQGVSIGVAVNRATNATVSMTFIYLVKALTIGGAFYLFMGLAASSFVFFYVFAPETRGRSLEEMETLFDPRKRRNQENGANVELQARPPQHF